jgi:hypothetical protein
VKPRIDIDYARPNKGKLRITPLVIIICLSAVALFKWKNGICEVRQRHWSLTLLTGGAFAFVIFKSPAAEVFVFGVPVFGNEVGIVLAILLPCVAGHWLTVAKPMP